MSANLQEIRDTVVQELQRIAPEADLALLDPQIELRDQLDIDSYDFLSFVIGLHEALDVDIPEADYQEVAKLDGAVGYLARTLEGRVNAAR